MKPNRSLLTSLSSPSGGYLRFWCSGLAILLIAAGCQPEEKIQTHRVAKDRSGLEALRQSATGTMPAAQPASVPTRMIVAMFDQPEKTWFFKVSGPAERVEAAAASVDEFFGNIKFVDGEPQWEVPADWSEGPAKPMRTATLLVDSGQPPLELAVSSLASGQDLLLNVNRWLGQLGKPPAADGQIDDYLERMTEGEFPFYRFDQTGSGSGQMRPPFAPFAGGAPNASSRPPATNPESPGDVTYETPDGWTAGNASSIVKARLKKELPEDGKLLEMTLIKMPADLNKWEPNVIRWAGQVNIEIQPDQIESLTTNLTVDGIEGQLIKLIDENQPRAILAALIKQGPNAWFLKISGPRKAVIDHEGDFESFANSIQF